jgi:hypothetical protein
VRARTPAIVITRDRVTYAKRCVDALVDAGCSVHIVDHESTWPEMVEWLARVDFPVYHVPNEIPRKLWDWSGLRDIACSGRYIVTDPDVVPQASCPRDWVRHLHSVLDENPGWLKVGLGLRIDDLPDYYSQAEKVREWEQQYWNQPINNGALFMAPVDTTLALYRSLDACDQFRLVPALRTQRPYLARHLTWYEDDQNPTPEIRYYREHAEVGISHWLNPDEYTRPIDTTARSVIAKEYSLPRGDWELLTRQESLDSSAPDSA